MIQVMICFGGEKMGVSFGGRTHVKGREEEGVWTLKYLTAKIRFNMKSIDHLIVHMDKPYRDWITRNDWMEGKVSGFVHHQGCLERRVDTYLGQSGDVEFVQLAHMVTNSAKISRHIQGNNETVEGSLYSGEQAGRWLVTS